MSRSRRFALVAATVLVAGMSVSTVSVSAAPQPGASCKVAGRERVTSAGTLRCQAVSGRSLRWRLVSAAVVPSTTSITSTTSTTAPSSSTPSAPVAPRVVNVAANDNEVRFTLSNMSPDTGVYAVQWVQQESSFTRYQMIRATSKTVSISAQTFRCDRTYTFRVFVMRADWTLSQGHTNQNVTPHSEPFDITMSHPCVNTAVQPLTCATGGTCVVGDTGPGGGIVFYVHSDADNMFTSNGSDCGTTCRYLEVTSSDISTGLAWAASVVTCFTDTGSTATNCQTGSVYDEAVSPGQVASRTASLAIGMGMTNTNLHYRLMTTNGSAVVTSYAAGLAWDYTSNGKSDWHLPSNDELNELCKYARQQTTGNPAVQCNNSGTLRGGFVADYYWSSSEVHASGAPAGREFGFADCCAGASNASKAFADRVRVVRAFG